MSTRPPRTIQTIPPVTTERDSDPAGSTTPMAHQVRDLGLPIGTRVRGQDTGRAGTVMNHEPQYSQGRFPVRFDDGIWEVHNAADVTVLAPPPTGTPGEGTRDD